jgi:hypothetical protein
MTADAVWRSPIFGAATAIVLLAGLVFCGMVDARAAEGDFGRIRRSLVFDDIHAWLGGAAANAAGEPASAFPLTDDERLLRDLAYPLIEPPYDRNRWYSILNEYGLTGAFGRGWFSFDVAAYYGQLLWWSHRSANARHAALNDDIRNDIVRIAPFFLLAQQVLDIDAKREKSLAYVSTLTNFEVVNARARNAENALIVG